MIEKHPWLSDALNWFFLFLIHKEIKRFLTAKFGRETKGDSMQLEKAWDVQALIADLKPKGLDLTEQAANDLVDSVLDWVDQSVVLTPSPLDDLEKVISAPLRPLIKSQIDKINGKVG